MVEMEIIAFALVAAPSTFYQVSLPKRRQYRLMASGDQWPPPADDKLAVVPCHDKFSLD